MQECWWGIPLRKIWGWARHRRHLLTCHWCPASRLLSYLFPSLSVLHPFKSYRRFAEASRFFLHSSWFAPIFFQYLCLPVSVPVHLPPRLILSVHPLLFLSLSPSLFFPFFPTRHLSQQSMPFHSGEGTNGIPAESVAAGGEQRFFLWLRLPLPAPLSAAETPACTRSLSPSRTHTHRPAVHRGTPWPYWHLQNVRLYITGERLMA